MKINLNLLSVFRDWRLIWQMKEKPWLISRVANPSEWMQMTAIKKDASFIGLIAHPTEKVQMTVVKNYRGSICHIQHPTENVQLYVIKDNPEEIKNIRCPTERVQLAVVEKQPAYIKYIANPTEQVQLAAVKEYSSYIGFIDNPTESVQLTAVNRNPWNIEFILNPSKKVQLVAVRADPRVIMKIRRPSAEACEEAVEEYFGNINPGIIHNGPSLVAATQKLFKQLLEIEKMYCRMKGDAFLTDNPSGKARLVDETRLVDKADWFRVEKISQALLVFKEEAGIILSQHNDRSRSELKQPVPVVTNNKKEITINH